MSEEDGFWYCCFALVVEAILIAFINWCEENPPCGIVVGLPVLGTMMGVLPVYWFIKKSKQRAKEVMVVVYFISFYAWIMAIILGIVGDLFAVYGVCVFLGTGIFGLIYLIIRRKMKKRKEQRKKAATWELKDQLKELKEQLSRDAITQKEYEQRRKKLLEKSPELKEQLEYEQKKNKMLEDRRKAIVVWELKDQLKELDEQLRSGAITQEEYEQEKKKLLEK